MQEVEKDTPQKENNEFEDQLKEILDFGLDKNPPCCNEKKQDNYHPKSGKEKRISVLIETIVRIIAAFLVIGLLIRFGLRIAYQ